MWRPASLLAVIVAVGGLLGACRIVVEDQGGMYECPDGRCPLGFACGTDGLCRQIGRPDAGPNDPDAGAGGCGKISLLADNFDGSRLGAQWTSSIGTGTSFDLTGGALVLQPATSVPGENYVSIESTDTYDITDSAVVLEKTEVVTGQNAQFFMWLEMGDDGLFMQVQEGMMFVNRITNGQTMNVIFSSAHSVNANRFWRVREAGGTLFAEASADGNAWNTLVDLPTPSAANTTRFRMLSGTNTSVANPGRMVIQSINRGVPSGTACP